MIFDDSRAAVTERLAGVLGQIRRALEAGLVVSRAIHDDQGWLPDADRILWPYLARREALEHLRDLRPALEDSEALGLPMSGILIEPTDHDVIRIWRSESGTLPLPRSQNIRAFYQQGRVDQEQLSLPGLDVGEPDSRRNHLAVTWWDDEATLTRLDLVRPCGIAAGRPVVEWTVNALAVAH